jgi:uncharacterized protein YukE
MADFTVNPAALETFAKTLSDVNTEAPLEWKYLIDNGDYTDKWVHLGGGDGGLIFQAIVDKTNQVHDTLVAQSYALRTALSESSDGLLRSAAEYRKDDHASAQQLDAAYKPGGVAPLDFTVEAGAKPEDPSAKLVEPGEEGAVPDMVQQILDGAGYFSESDLVIKILNLCGLDVMGWVKERFVGDFGAIARAKNAIEALGEFDEIAAANVAEGTSTMLASWTGNAADGAHSYFDQLANAIEGRGSMLGRLTGKYTAVLVGVQELGAALEGAITGAIDAAIEAAAALAAAGCLQEVPVVDVLIDIVGAWRVTKIIDAVHHVFSIWNWTWSAHEGLMGLIAGLVGVISDYNLADDLPATSYYNPSQGPPPKHEDDIPHGRGAR